MTVNWEPLRTIIADNRCFVLTCHVRPDADALGSELALAGLLEAMGKTVRIINPSAMPENLKFLDASDRIVKLDEGVTAAEAADTDVHIVLDTSAWVQLGNVADVFRTTSAAKVVIDHHVSSDALGAIEFKDTGAEATGAIIFRMAEALQLPVTPEIAVPLYAAIATDTGWFRFSSTSSDTMRIAGRLIDLGAQPHVLYQLLYERYTLARVELVGCVLSRVNLACDGRLAFTNATQADFVKTGAEPADTEDIVNECLGIDGTEAAYIAIEQQNKKIKVSFRSRSTLNVAEIAEQFGGGGHKQAAGAILSGPLAEAEAKVRSAMKAALEDN